MKLINKFKENIMVAKDEIETTNEVEKQQTNEIEKKETKIHKTMNKLITGFDETNKKDAYLRSKQETHSAFEIFWSFIEQCIYILLLIGAGWFIFDNYWEKMKTLKYLFMSLPALLVIIYQIALVVLPIIAIYKKIAKHTHFRVQKTINAFVSITITQYDPSDFENADEYKAFIITKAQAQLVKHPKWKEFINGGFKWYRQKRFADAKLLPICEVVYSNHHSNTYNSNANNRKKVKENEN